METTRFVTRLDPVWARLAKNNAKFLTAEQVELLDDMAFAAAVVGGCPGFQLDKTAFEQGFASLRSNEYMKLSATDKRTFEYKVMMAFGAASTLYTRKATCIRPKAAGSPRRAATVARVASGCSRRPRLRRRRRRSADVRGQSCSGVSMPSSSRPRASARAP